MPSSRCPSRPVFDAVLVDAPCSGLGVIRRDPDIKWRRTEADFGALAGCPAPAPGSGRERVADWRTPHLCDLFQRARGERRGRRRLPGRHGRTSQAGRAAGPLAKRPDAARSAAVDCARCLTTTASNRFSPRPWSKPLVRSKLQDSWHLRRASGARASCSCSAARSCLTYVVFRRGVDARRHPGARGHGSDARPDNR